MTSGKTNTKRYVALTTGENVDALLLSMRPSSSLPGTSAWTLAIRWCQVLQRAINAEGLLKFKVKAMHRCLAGERESVCVCVRVRAYVCVQ